MFAHACKMGLEGIVSKRKDSVYRSGRSPDWLKMKNPACAAVKREAEEDWGKRDGDDDGWPTSRRWALGESEIPEAGCHAAAPHD